MFQDVLLQQMDLIIGLLEIKVTQVFQLQQDGFQCLSAAQKIWDSKTDILTGTLFFGKPKTDFTKC